MFKYGLYEVFKDFYSNLAGKENAEKYKGLIWCAGSASAEVFADVALCPLEMVLKILTKLYIDYLYRPKSKFKLPQQVLSQLPFSPLYLK